MNEGPNSAISPDISALESTDSNQNPESEDDWVPGADPGEVAENVDSHRGALGDFGRDAMDTEAGFLDRSFRERIVIVGVTRDGHDTQDTEASLDELELLIDTAGADAVDRVTQRRARLDPATLVGRGKVQEILEACLAVDADTVVFDDELSPAQQFNLERILQRTALDRTAVILDIFAQHATSAEGKAQVELAQLRYNLPRLRGKKNYSQQGGGIGTRGPGETQIEVDRRRLVRRMHKLEKDLVGISARRSNQRKAQHRSPYKSVSIIGYTNAGKSTLLRAITGAAVKIEDRLFATLDPTTRKTQMPGGEQVLLTDTVGFVRKLPHQLVEAFKSTLEVVADADLLVHVVDGAGVDPYGHIDAVREVLREINADKVPELVVFNKADLAAPDGEIDVVTRLARQNHGAVGVSAATGVGIDVLREAIVDALHAMSRNYELFIPWDRGDILAAVHREGDVMSEQTEEKGMRVEARLEDASAKRLRRFVTAELSFQDESYQ